MLKSPSIFSLKLDISLFVKRESILLNFYVIFACKLRETDTWGCGGEGLVD